MSLIKIQTTNLIASIHINTQVITTQSLGDIATDDSTLSSENIISAISTATTVHQKLDNKVFSLDGDSSQLGSS
jgi:hypothetical protein